VSRPEKTRRDRKLDAILAAASEVFAETGYDRASIRLVAERAGTSVPGMYHYVDSKEELLFLIQLQVFTGLVECYRAASEGVAAPAERLELLIRSHLDRFLSHMAELVVCARENDRLSGGFRKQVAAKQREYFGIAVELFKEIGEHHGGSRVDPRTAALAMFGAINWVHTWYAPRSGSAARLAADFTQLFLGGTVPRDDPERTEGGPTSHADERGNR